MLSLRHTAIREALFILLSSCLLGFGYSIVMKKGFFAQQSVSPASNTASTPAFISYEEAVALHQSGALFVDARHEYDFKLGHIKDAVNVPLKDFALESSAIANTPKDRVIVTYCDGAECNSSIELAKKLAGAGFANVKMFFGGWNEWQQHGGATE
ncbi:MAG: rhodanese-like domain-containing protein [Ignavibacteriae bacterium]|nr:rhodanese-like domain-containing protein [Ignavibacteriota bacterium]